MSLQWADVLLCRRIVLEIFIFERTNCSGS